MNRKTLAISGLGLFLLVIGVIVDAMQSEHEQEARAERDAMMSETELILTEVRALRSEIKALGSEVAELKTRQR